MVTTEVFQMCFIALMDVPLKLVRGSITILLCAMTVEGCT